MPHPVYGPPNLSLERVSVHLAFDPTDGGIHAEIHGHSSLKRSALWVDTEEFERGAAVDLAQWVGARIGIVVEDRPFAQEQAELLFGSGLGTWEDVPFDW